MTTNDIRNTIEWKDLKKLTRKGKIQENLFSYPWLMISLFFAYHKYYILAFPFSAIFFMTCLRQVHNGIHNALGLNSTWTRISLLKNSILMTVSATAIKFNHLRHHKYNLSPEDYEGSTATMTWYQALLHGPVFMFNLHYKTFQKGNLKYKKQMFTELFGIVLFLIFIFYYNIDFLKFHIFVMIFCEMLMAFFAVWTVHHDTEDNPDFARTQRGWGWKNFITVGMFYHLEHHIFPGVPTHNLNKIAKRIDEKFPELNKRQVF